MAEWWRLALCVLLTSLSVYCANTPEKQQQAGVLNQNRIILGEGHDGASGLQIVVDQIQQTGKTIECTLSETPGGRTLQKIIDVGAERPYKFFIKPEPGFNRLIINAKLRINVVNRRSTSSLTINSSLMAIDWTQPTWIPVEIEYFKKVLSFRPDRHTLHVRVGEAVSEELTSKGWRPHTYEGFEVFALGPLKVLTNCRSWVTTPEPEPAVDIEDSRRNHTLHKVLTPEPEPVVDIGDSRRNHTLHKVLTPEPEPVVDIGDSRRNHILVIASVLAGCLLVVMVIAIFSLITRRCRSSQEHHDHLQSVPKAMPKQQGTSRDSVCENINESIDESTM